MSDAPLPDLNKCECCGVNDIIGVASSPLGPVSHGYCQECVQRYAEPAYMLDYTLDSCGGIENIREDIVTRITTFVEGGYISFTDYAAKHYKVSSHAV